MSLGTMWLLLVAQVASCCINAKAMHERVCPDFLKTGTHKPLQAADKAKSAKASRPAYACKMPARCLQDACKMPARCVEADLTSRCYNGASSLYRQQVCLQGRLGLSSAKRRIKRWNVTECDGMWEMCGCMEEWFQTVH